MKNKLYIFAAVAGIMSLSSCSDFLDQKNSYQASEDTFFATDEAVAQGTAPLYNYVWKSFKATDAQTTSPPAGQTIFTPTPTSLKTPFRRVLKTHGALSIPL